MRSPLAQRRSRGWPTTTAALRPAGIAAAALVTAIVSATAGVVLAQPAPRPSERPLLIPRNFAYLTATGANYTGYYYAPVATIPKGDVGPIPVIFFSDETSWRPLYQGVASDLAAAGRPVLGIDGPAYFKKMVPGSAYAKDLAYFRAFVNDQAKRPLNAPVLLAGMSFSAELVPYVLNRTGAAGVAGLLLIAPDGKGAAMHRAVVVLGMDSPADETFDVAREFAALQAIPTVLMQGTDDTKGTAHAFLGSLRGPKRLISVKGGDHEFRGRRDLLSDHVAEALRWLDAVIQAPPPAAASGPPAASPAPAPAPRPGAAPPTPSPTPRGRRAGGIR